MENTEYKDGLYIIENGCVVKKLDAIPFGKQVIKYQDGHAIFYTTEISSRLN